MRKNELIEAIITEMDRLWGVDGFNGTTDEYEWLQQNYGISEEDDAGNSFLNRTLMNSST